MDRDGTEQSHGAMQDLDLGDVELIRSSRDGWR